jgi:hypothetical protein
MIAGIEEDEIEPIQQQAPEWQIGIDRQPIAVAEDQSRTGRIAVPSEHDHGTVAHTKLNGSARRRHLEIRCAHIRSQPAPAFGTTPATNFSFGADSPAP